MVGITIGPGTRDGYSEVRFSVKPSGEVRDALKGAGFRWASSAGCWYGRTDRLGALPQGLLDRADRAAAPSVAPGTCPTCGKPGALTSYEARKGYQCRRCTDVDEGRGVERWSPSEASEASAAAPSTAVAPAPCSVRDALATESGAVAALRAELAALRAEVGALRVGAMSAPVAAPVAAQDAAPASVVKLTGPDSVASRIVAAKVARRAVTPKVGGLGRTLDVTAAGQWV